MAGNWRASCWKAWPTVAGRGSRTLDHRHRCEPFGRGAAWLTSLEPGAVAACQSGRGNAGIVITPRGFSGPSSRLPIDRCRNGVFVDLRVSRPIRRRLARPGAVRLGETLTARIPREAITGSLHVMWTGTGNLVLETAAWPKGASPRPIFSSRAFVTNPRGRRDGTMLLCIDCGNTNTVFSVWDGKTLPVHPAHGDRSYPRTADQYFVWFSALMAHHKIDDRDHGMHLVLDRSARGLQPARAVRPLLRLPSRWWWASPSVFCRSPPRVDQGTQVGPDRLVNTAGAFRAPWRRPDRGRFRHRHHL
jgi:hypothetical protein